jgi:hypothetical protein
MSAKNPESSLPNISHWPWHGWVENPIPYVPVQLTGKESPTTPLDLKNRIEDQEWEALVLRLF